MVAAVTATVAFALEIHEYTRFGSIPAQYLFSDLVDATVVCAGTLVSGILALVWWRHARGAAVALTGPIAVASTASSWLVFALSTVSESDQFATEARPIPFLFAYGLLVIGVTLALVAVLRRGLSRPPALAWVLAALIAVIGGAGQAAWQSWAVFDALPGKIWRASLAAALGLALGLALLLVARSGIVRLFVRLGW